MNPRMTAAKAAIRERLTHDLGPLGAMAAQAVYAGSRLAAAVQPKSRAKVLKALLRLHSGSFSPSVDQRITHQLRSALSDMSSTDGHALASMFSEIVDGAVEQYLHPQGRTRSRLIGARALVVKQARPSERGVLVIDYSYVFPLMHGLFDLR